jgi:DNA-binding MarR family transcriptional regulator
MTSKTLRSLEKQGWIQRTEHQTDTRAKIVTLTSSGETALQKALHIVEARDNALFDILGEQRESFADQLRTIWREGLKNG